MGDPGRQLRETAWPTPRLRPGTLVGELTLWVPAPLPLAWAPCIGRSLIWGMAGLAVVGRAAAVLEDTGRHLICGMTGLGACLAKTHCPLLEDLSNTVASASSLFTRSTDGSGGEPDAAAAATAAAATAAATSSAATSPSWPAELLRALRVSPSSLLDGALGDASATMAAALLAPNDDVAATAAAAAAAAAAATAVMLRSPEPQEGDCSPPWSAFVVGNVPLILSMLPAGIPMLPPSSRRRRPGPRISVSEADPASTLESLGEDSPPSATRLAPGRSGRPPVSCCCCPPCTLR